LKPLADRAFLDDEKQPEVSKVGIRLQNATVAPGCRSLAGLA
jgi:hypothetical protein